MKITKCIGKITILFFALTVLGIGSGEIEARSKRACKEDVEKYCKDVQKGEGRIMQCLEKERDRLSSACKARVDKKMAFQAACGSDMESYCPKARYDYKERRSCMRKNWDNFSEGCRTFLKEKKKKRGAKKDCEHGKDEHSKDKQA